jgi:hypothetical protein
VSLRRNSVQIGSASEVPISMPSTSRRPSKLTPTAMMTATETIAAAAAHIHLAVEHSRLTWLLETPLMPIALTRSSTERVETP